MLYNQNQLKQNQTAQQKFFISSRKDITAPKDKNAKLKATVEDMYNGIYPYFQTSKFKISEKNKWFYNPLSEHTYPQNIHWSKVTDFSEKKVTLNLFGKFRDFVICMI